MYRNGTLIANRTGVFINDPRFTQGVAEYGRPDSNNIYISNIRMNDSATFQCRDYYHVLLYSYDLRVITCSSCTRAAHSNTEKMKVICTLDNYMTGQMLEKDIILNGNIRRTAVILGSDFSFSIDVAQLNWLNSEFYLQIETESRSPACYQLNPRHPPPYYYATNDFFETNDAK